MANQQATQATKAAGDVPELPEPEFFTVDMKSDMRDFAVEAARKGVIKLNKNEIRQLWEVAEVIKLEMDRQYPGAWHVLVGKSFGAFVTQQANCLIYFSIGQASFLIFKHG
mmetsp:Transcript_55200/g.121007  ORF Transcript_55200/g.121007 Transcript_55200/m.121007 type:complete len:111 (-) Transcript_55200:25-357(-)